MNLRLALALMGGAAGLAASADQSPDSVDISVIRVNTHLVQVDAIVRNKDGPVADLTKDDFTVYDNGQPQKIAVFSVKSVRPGSTKPTPLPAGTVANRVNSLGEEPHAATVVLWDALNTEVGDQSWVRGEVLKYLRTMKEGDPVALYTMAKNLNVIQDFTADPKLLIQAVLRTRPEQSTALATELMADELKAANPAEKVDEMRDFAVRDRVYLTETCLEAIAQHLAGLPGRKTLIWITGSFPAMTREVRSHLGADPVTGKPYTQIEVQDFGPQITKAVRKLNHANVAVYPIDPRGLTYLPTKDYTPLPGGSAPPAGLTASGTNTMNLFAIGTGGRASYASNDIVSALHSAMEDDAVTYRLGYYSSDQKQDGAYHDLSVKVARKGVEVRSRKGYFAMDSKMTTNALWRDELDRSMSNPLEATSIGLRASAAPVAGRSGVYALQVAVDLADLHLERVKDRWVSLLSYATHLTPPETNRGTIETIRISLTEDRLRAVLKDGFVFRRTIEAGDQKGELRVTVEDRNTGALGSVTIPIGNP